jgi:hypothetical protein
LFQLFLSFNSGEITEVAHLAGYYSLIPLFPAKTDADKYEIYGKIPIPSNVPFAKKPVRIFDAATSHDEPHETGTIIYHRNPKLEDGPANYWYLPVPCHVILYLFFKVIDTSVSSRPDGTLASSRPEVVLGRKIYTKLKRIRDSELAITGGIGTKPSAEAEASDNDEVLSFLAVCHTCTDMLSTACADIRGLAVEYVGPS